MVQLTDALMIDKATRKTTRDGFVVVRANSAKTGIYDYLGREVDPEGKHFRPDQTVKVYRDADQVFDQASVASFLGKPLTDNHPAEPVTADNWRVHARGNVMAAMRDGDHLAFDLALMDAATIKAVESGKRELSNGYSCDLVIESGTTADGQQFDARQSNIRGNHVALVDRGRAGATCAIADQQRFAVCDALPSLTTDSGKEPTMKTIMHDGLPVNLGDEAAVVALVDKLKANAAKAVADAATLTTDLATANGKIAALETQLAEAKDAASPAKLDALAADRATLITAAKALVPTLATDGKDAATIRREAVAAKLGDRTPTEDAAVTGAFLALTADAKPAVQNIVPGVATDAASDLTKSREARKAALRDAHTK